MKNALRVLLVVAFVSAMVAGVMAQAKPANIAGKWEITSEGQNGPQTSTATFEQDGEKIKGTIEGARGGPANFEGTIKGNKASWKVTRTRPDGQTMTIEYNATVEGDTMKGTRGMGERTAEFTGKRAK
jgi:hypothetical protein